MRSTGALLVIALWGAVGCTAGQPGDDTDNPDDTDVVDTDVADTDVLDTDVVDTDTADTDVVDTDVVDTDVTDTDVGALVPDILSDTLYVNCMPSIPPDPVGGGFVVRYQNDDALASRARIQTATLTLNKSPLTSGSWSFDVTPAGSGNVPAGTHRDVTHDKVGGSGSGSAGGPCSFCGGTWTLDVSWQTGGSTVTDSFDAGTIDCVY